jgi:cytochrome c
MNAAMQRNGRLAAILVAGLLAPRPTLAEVGDPTRGAQLFDRACAACHSLAPGRHRTGPSLAGLLGRQAGTAEGFRRYSPALKGSSVVWGQAALDAWIADPQAAIPGNGMPFQGIPDPQMRADIVAFLGQPASEQAAGQQGGMMGDDEPPDLKTLGPEHQVTALRHCGDTYEVTTADDQTEPVWEFNLRLKTDSSDRGPAPGRPVIVGNGMRGDRVAVVFTAPAEISSFIEETCSPALRPGNMHPGETR